MREIKFRAWDRDNNKMLPVLNQIWWMDRSWLKDSDSTHTLRIQWEEDGKFEYWRDCIPTQIELLQFTGLKDKNGVDIYEGDWVQNSFYIEKAEGNKNVIDAGKGVVKWIPCGFAVHYSGIDVFNLEYMDEDDSLEVIGNIYENPNLLTNEQNPERSVATGDAQ